MSRENEYNDYLAAIFRETYKQTGDGQSPSFDDQRNWMWVVPIFSNEQKFDEMLGIPVLVSNKVSDTLLLIPSQDEKFYKFQRKFDDIMSTFSFDVWKKGGMDK